MIGTEISIRRASPTDMPFVFSSWLNHYKNYSSFARRIRKDIFMESHRKVLGHIIDKPHTFVLVATPMNDPEVLLGFIVYEKKDTGPVIHFCYVKQPFQRLGIAKSLVKEASIVGSESDWIEFTHWTYDMDKIEKKYPNLIYNPYKL